MEGVFSSEEHIIGTASGVVAVTGAVKEHPEIEWDSHLFDSIIGVTWDPLAKQRVINAEENPKERLADLPRLVIPRASDSEIPKPNRTLLQRVYFEKFGWTPGCRKCTALQSWDSSVTTGHSESCRERIEKILAEDPEMKRKLDRTRRR